MNKIKAGIVGATGYAGLELVRILSNHPYAEITAVSSVSYEGKKLSDVYPNFKGILDTVLENADAVVEKCDVIFTSLPHGLSEPIAEQCIAKNKLLIDLGADFRMYDEKAYSEWYGRDYSHPALHEYATYCLPELYRDNVKKAKIVGNPGCYPTSIALAAAPALPTPTRRSPHIRLASTVTPPKSSRPSAISRAKLSRSPSFLIFSPSTAE